MKNNKKTTIQMATALIIIVMILLLSVLAYKVADRVFPNAVLRFRKEFLYLGTDIKLTKFADNIDTIPLDMLIKSNKASLDNSLIIVSSDHPISDNLTFESVIEYKDTNLLFDYCVHEPYEKLSTYILNNFGEKLYITSAFRSAEEQQTLYDEKGNSIAQKPGESEHQTGLSLDIAVKGFGGASFLKTDTGKFINLSVWQFGFIIRYPEGKSDVTRIDYEPWHIRYVGAPHAEYISKNDITLEEYIQSLSEDTLYKYDTLDDYAVIKTNGKKEITVPKEYISCTVSPDNCGNYIITFKLK